MPNIFRYKTALLLLLFSIALFGQNRSDFPDVLNLKTEFPGAKKIDVNLFSDMGAWHAYSLSEDSKNYGGFLGPVVMDLHGEWIAESASKMKISENGRELNLAESTAKQHYYPGLLEQQFETAGLEIVQKLIFVNNRQAFIQTEMTNHSNTKRKLNIGFTGSFFNVLQADIENNQLNIKLKDSGNQFSIEFDHHPNISFSNGRYAADYGEITLKKGETQSFIQSQTYTLTAQDIFEHKSPSFESFQKELIANENRWNTYLKNYFAQTSQLDNIRQNLAVKSIITLITNWRSPAKDLKTDGVFPSVSYQGFYGFWSWDSWKIAVGISFFDTELAQKTVKSMFDYMDEDGMVADCIYTDKTENNWRDTKPPLSAWAVKRIYEQDGDLEFVREMYPKIVKYHYWWNTHRDHDQNGLCEFGSTDGTLIAAKWESGMDNAVRFDDAQLLQNNKNAWSFDLESVDLNSYLYAEKIFLSELAKIIGQQSESQQWIKGANELLRRMKGRFYDSESGYFYDKKLNSDELIKAQGPEGWTPLWTNFATLEEAEKVREIMLNPDKFQTLTPFPTLAADDPKFNPLKGYWRGPVWIDQLYFAIKGLEKYGYTEDARKIKENFIKDTEGMTDDKPIYENYHPITGKGLNARNFSWSAAHILMLLADFED